MDVCIPCDVFVLLTSTRSRTTGWILFRNTARPGCHRENIQEKLDFSLACAWKRDYNKLRTHPSRNTRQVLGLGVGWGGGEKVEKERQERKRDSRSRYCCSPLCHVASAPPGRIYVYYTQWFHNAISSFSPFLVLIRDRYFSRRELTSPRILRTR